MHTAVKRCGPRRGSAILHPKEIESRYDITAVTRWRWEKNGRLPPRDVFIGGAPAGWRPETIERAERGQIAA